MKKRVLFVFILIILLSFLVLSLSKETNTTQFSVTQEHPFLINNTWIPASELKVGDEIKTIEGKKARITEIIDVQEEVPVYNLEAGIYHNFVVSEDNLVVHNSNKLLGNSRRTYTGKMIVDSPVSEARLNKGMEVLKELGEPLPDKETLKKAIDATHRYSLSTMNKRRLLMKYGLTKRQSSKLLREGICGLVDIKVHIPGLINKGSKIKTTDALLYTEKESSKSAVKTMFEIHTNPTIPGKTKLNPDIAKMNIDEFILELDNAIRSTARPGPDNYPVFRMPDSSSSRTFGKNSRLLKGVKIKDQNFAVEIELDKTLLELMNCDEGTEIDAVLRHINPYE
jgi:hypothetical protein